MKCELAIKVANDVLTDDEKIQNEEVPHER